MGYIEIDLERLETAKYGAKSYCDFHDDVQKKMLETLRNLRETWTGTDAEQFQKRLKTILMHILFNSVPLPERNHMQNI